MAQRKNLFSSSGSLKLTYCQPDEDGNFRLVNREQLQECLSRHEEYIRISTENWENNPAPHWNRAVKNDYSPKLHTSSQFITLEYTNTGNLLNNVLRLTIENLNRRDTSFKITFTSRDINEGSLILHFANLINRKVLPTAKVTYPPTECTINQTGVVSLTADLQNAKNLEQLKDFINNFITYFNLGGTSIENELHARCFLSKISSKAEPSIAPLADV